ncbi:MAG TPA: hypothetical protein VKZ88_02975, partial [Fibrobacteria bacterium]|nr:hypothetical protein [Fibrobacteria bacterium]
MNPVSVLFRSPFPALPALTFCAALFASLFAPAPVRAQTVDTLEVFVLYIEFGNDLNRETDANDEPGTTGLGRFGSATGADHNYALDPNGPSFRRS